MTFKPPFYVRLLNVSESNEGEHLNRPKRYGVQSIIDTINYCLSEVLG